MQNQDVTFIRKNGRVIPIKQKKSGSPTKKQSQKQKKPETRADRAKRWGKYGAAIGFGTGTIGGLAGGAKGFALLGGVVQAPITGAFAAGLGALTYSKKNKKKK